MNSEFPNEIDLGKKSSMSGMEPASPSKPDKNKKYYPTLYLSDIPGLEDLPECGEALICFNRRGLTIRKPASGESKDGAKCSVSTELEICKICLPEPEGDESDDKGDMIDELAEKAGINTGKKKAKVEDADEDGE